MKWSSQLSLPAGEQSSLKSVLVDCIAKIRADLGGQAPDLAVGFVSPHFLLDYEAIPPIVASELGAGVFIGCSAGGLIGGGVEVEQQPAVALTAAVLPEVSLQPLHVEDAALPDLDDPPAAWEKLVGVATGREP